MEWNAQLLARASERQLQVFYHACHGELWKLEAAALRRAAAEL
jgi:hypothetical protein